MIRKAYIGLILIWIFITTIQPPIDLDLGWHLRYGQYFFQTGHVLRENILSFVWPAYSWVQASWGYDLLVYQLFTHGGFFAIALACAAFTLATFIVLVRPIGNVPTYLLLLLASVFLSQTAPMYIASLRSQTPSALLFALCIVSIHQLIRGRSPWLLWALPALFFIWANMHGGFVLGLFLGFLMWTTAGMKTHKALGVSLLCAFVASLVNPWGMRLYTETLRHMTNMNLTVIGEWMPITTGMVETTILLAICLVASGLLVRRKAHGDLSLFVALLVTTGLALVALRFVTNFGIIATYILANTLPQILAHKQRTIKAIITIFTFIIIFLDTFFTQKFFLPPTPFSLYTYQWKDYCTIIQCSEEITTRMKKNPPSGNGYHPYNYGGYLSWRVPEVKTFVDGRMSAWEDHGDTPPIGQSNDIALARTPALFRTYDSLYYFGWVILPASSPLVSYITQLSHAGLWSISYQDNQFFYAVRTQ